MKLSVAVAGAMFMLASLSACIGDWASEEVDELIEYAEEDVFGTPTPQSGGVPAPPGRNAPTETPSGTLTPLVGPRVQGPGLLLTSVSAVTSRQVV